MSRIEPGWYRDPAAPETQRYWNGEIWVGRPVPIDETPPDEPEPVPKPEPEPAPAASGPGEDGLPPGWRQARGVAIPPPGIPIGAEPRGTIDETVDGLKRGRVLATPMLRLAARLVDVMIVLGLNVLVNGWFVYQYIQEISPVIDEVSAGTNPFDIDISGRAQNLQIVIMLIAAALWFGYEVPSTVNSGQTFGKRVVGIRVESLLDRPVRYSGVTARWLMLALPAVCFPFGVIAWLVDSLWCLRDKYFSQCLHDKPAGTVVVQVKPEQPGG